MPRPMPHAALAAGDPAPRPPRLVLWHLEKGGGESVISWLDQVIGRSSYDVVYEPQMMVDPHWDDDHFRVGLIREPCDYAVSEYMFGRRTNFTDSGLGHMRYSLTGQGFGELYEGDEKAGFKRWLRFVHGLNEHDGKDGRGRLVLERHDDAAQHCGLLSIRFWTQIVDTDAAYKINVEKVMVLRDFIADALRSGIIAMGINATGASKETMAQLIAGRTSTTTAQLSYWRILSRGTVCGNALTTTTGASQEIDRLKSLR